MKALSRPQSADIGKKQHQISSYLPFSPLLFSSSHPPYPGMAGVMQNNCWAHPKSRAWDRKWDRKSFWALLAGSAQYLDTFSANPGQEATLRTLITATIPPVFLWSESSRNSEPQGVWGYVTKAALLSCTPPELQFVIWVRQTDHKLGAE